MQPKTGKKDLHSLSTIWFFPEDPADATLPQPLWHRPKDHPNQELPQHRPWILSMDSHAGHTHTPEQRRIRIEKAL